MNIIIYFQHINQQISQYEPVSKSTPKLNQQEPKYNDSKDDSKKEQRALKYPGTLQIQSCFAGQNIANSSKFQKCPSARNYNNCGDTERTEMGHTKAYHCTPLELTANSTCTQESLFGDNDNAITKQKPEETDRNKSPTKLLNCPHNTVTWNKDIGNPLQPMRRAVLDNPAFEKTHLAETPSCKSFVNS